MTIKAKRESRLADKIPSYSAFTVANALCQVAVMMAVLSWFYLSAPPFLNLVMSRMFIAGHPSHSLNLFRSPENDFRADFYSRFGAGPLNPAA